MGNRKKLILLIIVFLVFTFFRFYNFFERLSFDWDQEYFSYQVKKIINGKLTLIGPRVNNDKGFFLGPYFFYLLTPFYLLTNLHPIGLSYYVIFYNFLFFFLSLFVLIKIFDFYRAVFFLFFWSINPLLIVFDITPWNVNWVIVGIFLAIFSLYRLYQTKKISKLTVFLLGFLLGIFLNFHFQFIFIIFFCLLFFFFIYKKSLYVYLKNISILLIGVILSFLPIFIFDLRHNFLNVKAFFEFFFNNKNIFQDRNVWFTVYTNAFSPIFIKRESFLAAFFYFLIISFLVYLTLKNKNNFYNLVFRSILGIWLIFPLFFSFWGTRPSEYYFYFLYPFVFLVLIEFFFLIRKQFFLIVYLIVLILFNFNSLKNAIKPYDYGLYYKEKSIKKIKDMVDQSKNFNITFDTPLGLNNGFNYLIDYYKIKQSKNFSDPLIEIRIPPREKDIKINQIGLKIPEKIIKKTKK